MLDDSHYRSSLAWGDVMLVVALAVAVLTYVLL